MNEPKVPDRSLADYVEANHKLLSVLGVLVALSIFARNLPDKQIGALLGYLFFSCAVLVYVELIVRFENSDNWRLVWFQFLLFLAFLILAMLWLVDLQHFEGESGVRNLLLFVTLMGLFGLLRLLTQISFVRQRMAKWRGTNGKLVSVAIVLVLLGLFLCAQAISKRFAGPVASALKAMAPDTTQTNAMPRR